MKGRRVRFVTGRVTERKPKPRVWCSVHRRYFIGKCNYCKKKDS